MKQNHRLCKRYKKRSALLVLLAVLMIVMTACGGGSDVPEEEDQDYGPILPADGQVVDIEGCLSDFTTIDLDGNEVDESIFADYDYTVIDIWGTYCDPCIAAMPDNEALYQKWKDKGVGFVGIVIDVQDEDMTSDPEQVKTAKLIEEEQGTTYPCLQMSKEWDPLISQVMAIPCYLVVDSKGEPVTNLIIAARDQSDWEEAFDALLAE